MLCFQVVKEALLPWLHLVHSVTPGAAVLLVCSHAESPPADVEDAKWWREYVLDMAQKIYKKVLLCRAQTCRLPVPWNTVSQCEGLYD